MKKILMAAILVSVFCILSSAANGEPIETVQYAAWPVTAVEANDTALDPNTTMNWATAMTWPDIPTYFNGLKVMFYASEPNDPNGETLDANDCTFNYKFYVAEYLGTPQLVADGNCVVGAMHLSHDPVSGAEFNSGAVSMKYNWVDTLGTITTDWKGGTTTGVLKQNDGGANSAAAFIFDRQGAKKMKCVITGRSSSYLHVWCIVYGY